MNEGAFALLDCLGFKGIWNRGVTPEAVVAFMKESKAHAESTVKRWMAGFVEESSPQLCIAFVSDSIAIGASTSQKPPLADWQKGYLILLVIAMCIELMQRFSGPQAPIPLVFRGSITFGPHLVHDAFFLGPAVDEAASLAQVGQGAFVWLTPDAHRNYSAFTRDFSSLVLQKLQQLPSDEIIRRADSLLLTASTLSSNPPDQTQNAMARWRAANQEKKLSAADLLFRWFLSSFRSDLVLPSYPMELKSGGTLQAAVVNLLAAVPDAAHLSSIARILSGFDGNNNLDVLLKGQSTERLLSKGAEAAKAANKQAQQVIAQYIPAIDTALA